MNLLAESFMPVRSTGNVASAVQFKVAGSFNLNCTAWPHLIKPPRPLLPKQGAVGSNPTEPSILRDVAPYGQDAISDCWTP